jgi:serine/threonine protein kinase
MRCVLERAFGCLSNALAFMHAQRIRHKDIKPQNVLVHQGNVIFTDFGYSLDSSCYSNSVTEGRPSFLTRRYSAPEVIEHDRRDSRSDVWSLGCVFLELFSALTQSFTIDTDNCFSEDIVQLHDTISQVYVPSKYSFLVRIITGMRSQLALDRPLSNEVATRMLAHPEFSCLKCRTSGKQEKTLGVIRNGGWIWSAPHNYHYCVGCDSEGNMPLMRYPIH